MMCIRCRYCLSIDCSDTICVSDEPQYEIGYTKIMEDCSKMSNIIAKKYGISINKLHSTYLYPENSSIKLSFDTIQQYTRILEIYQDAYNHCMKKIDSYFK